MKSIVILYHADCPDGFSGAWAAWKKFGNKADYIPAEYQTQPPKGLKNKEIYFIDFIYQHSPAIIKKLSSENKKVVVIDHHASAESMVKSVPEHIFDINHSGAFLAWRYFHKNQAVPKLIRYIENVDLWKFTLPNSKKISSFIEAVDMNFRDWSRLASDLENSAKRKKIIEWGKIILKYEDKVIDRIIKEDAETVKFAGYKTMAVNTQFAHSQLGNELVRRMPPISITWAQQNDRRFFSLRSNGKVDVGQIAKKFGGGGHKAAAGFSLPANKPLPWKPIN